MSFLGLTTSFYNQTIRKYVTIFGTMFSELDIDRVDGAGVFHSNVKVPIAYGPKQKYLAQLDRVNKNHAMVLPRMSFEMTSMSFDTGRALNKLNEYVWDDVVDDTKANSKFMPVPYDFSFQLTILVLNAEDGTRIVEQILPFFTPDFTVTANLVEGTSNQFDIPVILDNVSVDDAYDGDLVTRRVLIWTLDFTLKGWLFGPQRSSSIIRQIDLNMFDSITALDKVESIGIVPGLVGQTGVDPTTVGPDDNFRGVVTITSDLTNTP